MGAGGARQRGPRGNTRRRRRGMAASGSAPALRTKAGCPRLASAACWGSAAAPPTPPSTAPAGRNPALGRRICCLCWLLWWRCRTEVHARSPPWRRPSRCAQALLPGFAAWLCPCGGLPPPACTPPAPSPASRPPAARQSRGLTFCRSARDTSTTRPFRPSEAICRRHGGGGGRSSQHHAPRHPAPASVPLLWPARVLPSLRPNNASCQRAAPAPPAPRRLPPPLPSPPAPPPARSVREAAQAGAACQARGGHVPGGAGPGRAGRTLVPWVRVTSVLPTLRVLNMLGALMSYLRVGGQAGGRAGRQAGGGKRPVTSTSCTLLPRHPRAACQPCGPAAPSLLPFRPPRLHDPAARRCAAPLQLRAASCCCQTAAPKLPRCGKHAASCTHQSFLLKGSTLQKHTSGSWLAVCPPISSLLLPAPHQACPTTCEREHAAAEQAPPHAALTSSSCRPSCPWTGACSCLQGKETESTGS